jgi:hypothetical protein
MTNTNTPTLNQLAALDGLYVIQLELIYPQQHITQVYGIAQNVTAADQETEWLSHIWEDRRNAWLYQSNPTRWVELAYHDRVPAIPDDIRPTRVGPFRLILETDPDDQS